MPVFSCPLCIQICRDQDQWKTHLIKVHHVGKPESWFTMQLEERKKSMTKERGLQDKSKNGDEATNPKQGSVQAISCTEEKRNDTFGKKEEVKRCTDTPTRKRSFPAMKISEVKKKDIFSVPPEHKGMKETMKKSEPVVLNIPPIFQNWNFKGGNKKEVPCTITREEEVIIGKQMEVFELEKQKNVERPAGPLFKTEELVQKLNALIQIPEPVSPIVDPWTKHIKYLDSILSPDKPGKRNNEEPRYEEKSCKKEDNYPELKIIELPKRKRGIIDEREKEKVRRMAVGKQVERAIRLCQKQASTMSAVEIFKEIGQRFPKVPATWLPAVVKAHYTSKPTFLKQNEGPEMGHSTTKMIEYKFLPFSSKVRVLSEEKKSPSKTTEE